MKDSYDTHEFEVNLNKWKFFKIKEKYTMRTTN